MDETIDLCDSDSESSSQRSSKRPNEIEVITLDDSCGRESAFRFSALPKHPKRPKLELNTNQENDDEIEIIDVKIKESPPNVKSKSKRKKSQIQSPFIYRRISANSRISLDVLRAKSISRGKTRKAALKKRKGLRVKNNSPLKTKWKRTQQGEISPFNTKWKRTQRMAGNKAVQVLQDCESSGNRLGKSTPPSKLKGKKKVRIPLQNGKPKFRMEPFTVKPHVQESNLTNNNNNNIEFNQPTRILRSRLDVPFGRLNVGSDSACAPDNTEGIGEVTTDSTGVTTNPPSGEAEEVSSQSNWSRFGSNIYNSDPSQPRVKGSLRPIAIDGSNVAWGHGNNRIYSCRGIQVCSDFFKARGHSVIAFVPRFRQKNSCSRDTHILDDLEKQGIVKFTPSREVDGTRICSYDDRFIVQYAADTGGIIVSNDNFRDLFEEQPLWRDAIRNRVLQFTWISENYIMFPPDPLGGNGPPLDEFLRF